LKLESQDIKNQKIQELKNIFPEIFKDGQINYDILKEILGDEIDEVQSEHYSFSWAGKKECYKTIKEKSNSTLKVDSDTTIPDGENVFIEGDNLEVLKLLQTSYHKKVKMIYIDPPYNKDKDFVYSDTWGDSITNYLIQTDQLRDEGYTTSKTNSTGRRHTNWLNMIYPRLWLSRNLLKDDGVIFVSIDDDEVHNLRKVMDEIYGEENFVEQIIWKRRATPPNDRVIGRNHEYILIYAKKVEELKLYLQPRSEKLNSQYDNPDNDPRGKWTSSDLSANGKGNRLAESCVFPILNPNDNKFYNPPKNKCWLYNEDKINKLIEEGRIGFRKQSGAPFLKRYLSEVRDGSTLATIVTDGGFSSDSAKELREIFDNDYFDFPKPISLLKKLLLTGSRENDIILDFFAGSGTTAHAVMELNQEDNGNRKYILVQLPETTDEKSEAYKNGYKKISDITKERIKRVIEKLDYKDGFKSYYLDNSNFQVFKELKKRPNDSFEDIVKMLKMSVFNKNIFAQGAKELDIVVEAGLKNGFSLSAKNEEIDLGTYKAIKLYEEDRVFYFCFADKVEMDIQEFIPEGVKLICYDKAFDDSTKLNLRQNIDLETL
jgi:adenine-specific DNA-methyltransferase